MRGQLRSIPYLGEYMEIDTQQYENLVPKDLQEKVKRLDEIDTLLMRSVLEKRFLPEDELKHLLTETTSLYSTFTKQHYTFYAISHSEETSFYKMKKDEAAARGEKFVSAPVEREAAFHVRTVEFLSTYYEGQMYRAESIMNTTKRLLNGKEERRTAWAEAKEEK
jgi:hypothetical protein